MNDIITKGEITIEPIIDLKNQTITIEMESKLNDMVLHHSNEIIDLKDKAIREALITMGWTPPPSGY